MFRSVWLVAALCLGLSACASHRTMLDLQRAPVPNALVFTVPPGHPLYHTVVIDYISGMSYHSFWFAEANQNAFRPQLQKALDDSGMAAQSPISARYGLQIEFTKLRTSFFGLTLESRSRAIYRIIDRRTGRAFFQGPIESSFSAKFVGLTENDAVNAVPNALVAPFIFFDAAGNPNYVELSKRVFWKPLFGWANFNGDDAEVRAHALKGDLDRSGYGSRDGKTRAKQADFQMMRQSIAKFLLAVSAAQKIPMTQVLPCLSNSDIIQEKARIEAKGMRWVEEDCGVDNERVRVVY